MQINLSIMMFKLLSGMLTLRSAERASTEQPSEMLESGEYRPGALPAVMTRVLDLLSQDRRRLRLAMRKGGLMRNLRALQNPLA